MHTDLASLCARLRIRIRQRGPRFELSGRGRVVSFWPASGLAFVEGTTYTERHASPQSVCELVTKGPGAVRRVRCSSTR